MDYLSLVLNESVVFCLTFSSKENSLVNSSSATILVVCRRLNFSFVDLIIVPYVSRSYFCSHSFETKCRIGMWHTNK